MNQINDDVHLCEAVWCKLLHGLGRTLHPDSVRNNANNSAYDIHN
jgi:hypothetical protein